MVCCLTARNIETRLQARRLFCIGVLLRICACMLLTASRKINRLLMYISARDNGSLSVVQNRHVRIDGFCYHGTLTSFLLWLSPHNCCRPICNWYRECHSWRHHIELFVRGRGDTPPGPGVTDTWTMLEQIWFRRRRGPGMGCPLSIRSVYHRQSPYCDVGGFWK